MYESGAGTRVKLLPDSSATTATFAYLPASAMAFFDQSPVFRNAIVSPAALRFMGAAANWPRAPPCRNKVA